MTYAPDPARIDRLLRSCVDCGLCLPHCATYMATGDETLSPRGRLILLGEVLHGRLSAEEPSVRRSFDLCLGCMACSDTCPSGVSFDLFEHLKDLAAGDAGRAGPVPVSALENKHVLRPLRRTGTVVRGVLSRTLGSRWRPRLAGAPRPLAGLARLLGSMPTSPGSDAGLVRRLDRMTAGRDIRMHHFSAPTTPPAATPLRLVMFDGCADGALLPGSARRLRALLKGLGCDVRTPAGQVCCGALATHTGRGERADILRDDNVAVFADVLPDCDHIVVAAAGCGLELQRYPEAFASRIIDAVVLLDRLAPVDLGAVPLRVALHDPCHARHGQGIVEEPRRLLRRIPALELLEPEEADVCCGSAGAYAVQHTELSEAMGRRKAEVLADTGCDLVVTSNPGCLGQIADGLAFVAPDIPILPLTDLLWYARMGGAGREERS